MDKPKVLVIDDRQTVRHLLKRTLGKEYEIDTAEDGRVALEKTQKKFFNLLITDLKMPEINGIDVLKEIKKSNPYIEVIIITGYPTIESAVTSIKIGAFDYLSKPFDMSQIASTVSKCLDKQKFTSSHIELSELMTLFNISKAITNAKSLNSVLEVILDSALRLVKAKRGSILLPDENSGELNIKVARGINNEIISNTRIKPDQGICGRVLKEGEPLLVTDIEQDNRFRCKNKPQYQTKSFISILLVIRHEKKDVIGVMNITDKTSGENFTKREQILLSVLGGQACAVIENYRLYNQLQNKIKDLKHTIRELNTTQNQLIQSEKITAVGQLAVGIAHEIRNPLGIILGGVDFIKNRMANKDNDIRESIEKIKLSIDRANHIIVDLLKFSKASRLKLSSINVCKIMDKTVELIENQANLMGVNIIKNYSNKNVKTKADPVLLQQVFFNLCANAIDAMPRGGQLTLNIYPGQGVKKNKSNITVEIADTGKGIPRDLLPKIFDPFYTTKKTGKGIGLGLSIVRMILDRHKGTINVESEAKKGAKFIIKLPLYNN